jgi:hypothetical protein
MSISLSSIAVNVKLEVFLQRETLQEVAQEIDIGIEYFIKSGINIPISEVA